MADYSKPNFNNLPFRFTSEGYSAPNFSNIHFSFGALTPSYQQTADLQAAINVMGLYQETTYSYLKECPTIVVGYVDGVPQILQLPCVYGGIRDLGALLSVLPPNVDLPAYIKAVSDYENLIAYIKIVTAASENLPGYLFSIEPEDLPAHLSGWDLKNLPAILGGWAHANFPACLYVVPPSDLLAYLNVIEIRNLPATLNGIWLQSQSDLGAYFHNIFAGGVLNLTGYLHGWTHAYLPAVLNVMQYRDLPATVGPIRISNLSASIAIVLGIDLSASLYGWASKDLPAYLVGSFGPGDLRAYIAGVGPKDLSATIDPIKGMAMPFDLRAYLDGSSPEDLRAIIGVIAAANLIGTINVTGGSLDLLASILPKTILIRKAISISLMEHLDLKAMVNYRCLSSMSSNLSAYLYPLMKKDLRAQITGWFGGTSDNVSDLTAFINVGDIFVQDIDTVRYVPESSRYKYSILKLNFSSYDSGYIVFNTFNIAYSTKYIQNLPASINPVLTNKDLSAYVNPTFDWNYTELPPWIIPKTREVVINTEKLENQWSKFVEIMFDNQTDNDYHYFYVEGSGQVYRVDRTKHWTVWVKSFVEDDDSMLDRGNVRVKYGFDMSNYNTVDEAIRDLIDRVSAYRKINLSASINAVIANYLNLKAQINPLVIYSWSKNLTTSLTPVTPADLGTTITGV
jgi:hypothetical protein